MDWLNYHHLLNFWLVAREGSVQKASEALYVTPASVSQQVRELERELGVKLLKKRGRGLVLTEMGEQVAEYASEIFATGRELLEVVKGRPTGRPLEFRVGIRDVMPKLLAYQLLQPALDLKPPVKLVCHEGDTPALVADLSVYRLDVVLSDTALDPYYRVRAYSHLLAESEVLIVAAAKLARKYRRTFPESLDRAPFLLPTEDSSLRRSLDLWFHERGLTPFIQGEFADSAMLKIAGNRGTGLLAIPAIIEEEVKSMYGLHRVGLVEGITERFYAISIERKLKHPGVAAIQEGAASTTATT
ncbi:LysR family transcriptional regulator [Rubinisphaera margarita]|uniref:LysR family transcriptional regulator n=1 Tax=Rubinisphaera margarita TaxID=2909586 RepID=UPI001EE90772|nr:LysR family transcriptional regulator [Rubinisphaera margarita]MCG6158275.1 LysR family transcriptional regulator [Rubinisphaera margarita]